jgi:hypothetical protein
MISLKDSIIVLVNFHHTIKERKVNGTGGRKDPNRFLWI